MTFRWILWAQLLRLNMVVVASLHTNQITKSEFRFEIDYANNSFVMDGQPFRFISGSMHYSRVLRSHWYDRMQKMKAAGLNAIQFYVEWNLHEPMPGKFNFKDNLDIEAYLQLAHKMGFKVIIRLGPYICAERDFGGLPYWLLVKHPDMRLRSSDPRYLKSVFRWWHKLMPIIRRHLHTGIGGPIIMVQIENEYGSYGTATRKCDKDYLKKLRDKLIELLGNEVVLYTTDGVNIDLLKCGKIPGVYATIDFGAGSNATEMFKLQKIVEPRGPMVNSEFYVGWLDHWSEAHHQISSRMTAIALDSMLKMGANVNIYMMHGGTNFGFESGANGASPYQPVPTSYDYDAPISESGTLRPKYFEIKNVIYQNTDKSIDKLMEKFQKSTSYGYGKIQMKFVSSIFRGLDSLAKNRQINQKLPLTFEELDLNHGYVLYETRIPSLQTDPTILRFKDEIHDRGYIFLDETFIGIVGRAEHINNLPLSARINQKLQILVENQGRINYGPDMGGIHDSKGIGSSVTLGNSPKTLENWNMTSIPFANGFKLEEFVNSIFQKASIDINAKKLLQLDMSNHNGRTSIWYGEFRSLCNQTKQHDTFLDPSGWKKGIAFINGFHIGRYWPIVGPQVTLYVPSNLLHSSCKEMNRIIIFEQEQPLCQEKQPLKNVVNSCFISFVKQPVINSTTPT